MGGSQRSWCPGTGLRLKRLSHHSFSAATRQTGGRWSSRKPLDKRRERGQRGPRAYFHPPQSPPGPPPRLPSQRRPRVLPRDGFPCVPAPPRPVWVAEDIFP